MRRKKGRRGNYSFMRNIAIIYILFLSSFFAYAQVTNDNIANRIELLPDSAPVYSNTFKATVEWACINRALTNSCLVYHNDQWFYFNTPVSGKQYLNITNQQCKNFKGVQVVVIEGNPCETETYKLIHCTTFTDQNDTFIELNSLKQGVQYLVLIDGFLGDQCHFMIQVGSLSVGFPENRLSRDTLSLSAEQEGKNVVLTWQVSQQQLDELDHFEIFRQQSKEPKAERLNDVAITTNALGTHTEKYVYKDSLSETGAYRYRIVGVSKEKVERIVLDEVRVEFYPPRPERVVERKIIRFPADFQMSGEVKIVVADAVKGTALFGVTIQDGRNTIVPVDVTMYVAAGKRFFRVKATHVKSGNMITRTFAWNEEEWVVVPK
ncbi:MAG: hypothetical protein KF845_01190 [Cyclobacteriaceae bacterium]|nr:hypothetical protein [Cyclobacteriaceae bacterium]